MLETDPRSISSERVILIARPYPNERITSAVDHAPCGDALYGILRTGDGVDAPESRACRDPGALPCLDEEDDKMAHVPAPYLPKVTNTDSRLRSNKNRECSVN